MQAQDKGGGTPPPIIEVNELLFFYQNMLGIMEENILTAICCKTFDLNEIKEARNILYNSLVTEKEQPNFHKRKSIKTNLPLNTSGQYRGQKIISPLPSFFVFFIAFPGSV